MTEPPKRPLPIRARWHADGIPMDDLFRADPAAPTATLPALPQRTRPTGSTGPTGPTRRTLPSPSTRPSPSVQPSPSAADKPCGLPLRPPPDDPELVERGGLAVPGWLAVLVGLSALAGAGELLWRARPLRTVRLELWEWALFGGCVAVAVLAFGGLTRGRTGSAWVLSLFGRYRGSVRRTGLVWISPFVLRRRVDVRLRHWRSEPIAVVDAEGAALRVVVLVVWSVKDTARALLAVDAHLDYLREQVEAAAARVLSQLPADAFRGDGPTLRDAEAVGASLTRLLAAECRPVGIAVFSAQPTRIEYAPEVAAAMQRRQIAALDAKHRDTVLTSVIDAVDDTVTRLTSRGLVELDDFERQALVKDLTVAFYTRRGGLAEQGQE